MTETDYDAFKDGIEVDVAVLGGGTAGITTAAKLRDAGKPVVIVERAHILKGAPGHMTAKLTTLHDRISNHLLEYFGEQRA